MRLLVTNTCYSQAYYIIRALRPCADRVVATVEPSRVGPLRSHAAFSRLVDARYRVPDPGADWRRGLVQADNTAAESEFIDRILQICGQESIDVVFPSADPWVYVLSKNKARFETLGITLPVPDFGALQIPLDKYRTVRAAQASNFPTPKTVLGCSDDATAAFAEQVPAPWVIKPRCTLGSQGMKIVSRPSDLLRETRATRSQRGAPLLQEYIPGREKRNFYLMADRDSEVISVLSPRVLRYSRRLFSGMSAACESAAPEQLEAELRALVRSLGLWGGMAVQTKIDVRDGIPKLMEINPRLGRALWYRTALGLNEPLISIQLARGEAPNSVPSLPQGCLLLQPIEDAFGLLFESLDSAVYRFRVGVLGGTPLDPDNPPTGLVKLLKDYRRQYFGGQDRCFSPYARYALSDPVPALVWCCMIGKWYLGAALKGELGR